MRSFDWSNPILKLLWGQISYGEFAIASAKKNGGKFSKDCSIDIISMVAAKNTTQPYF